MLHNRQRTLAKIAFQHHGDHVLSCRAILGGQQTCRCMQAFRKPSHRPAVLLSSALELDRLASAAYPNNSTGSKRCVSNPPPSNGDARARLLILIVTAQPMTTGMGVSRRRPNRVEGLEKCFPPAARATNWPFRAPLTANPAANALVCSVDKSRLPGADRGDVEGQCAQVVKFPIACRGVCGRRKCWARPALNLRPMYGTFFGPGAAVLARACPIRAAGWIANLTDAAPFPPTKWAADGSGCAGPRNGPTPGLPGTARAGFMLGDGRAGGGECLDASPEAMHAARSIAQCLDGRAPMQRRAIVADGRRSGNPPRRITCCVNNFRNTGRARLEIGLDLADAARRLRARRHRR